MAIAAFSEFGEMQVSFMQEMGNMGTGNAATALADMIGSPTDISCPQVRQLGIAEARMIVDKLSSATVSRLISLSGDVSGSLLFIMPFEFTERLAGTFFPGTSVKSRADIDEMIGSVINEMVNIVAASYVNCFSEMTGLFIDISVPQDLPAPSEKVLAEYPAGTQTLYFINTSMIITDVGKQCNLLYFPTLESVLTYMRKLGMDC